MIIYSMLHSFIHTCARVGVHMSLILCLLSLLLLLLFMLICIYSYNIFCTHIQPLEAAIQEVKNQMELQSLGKMGPFCGLEKLHLFVQTVPASDIDLMLSCLIRSGPTLYDFFVPQSFVWSHTTSTSSFICFANCI